MPKSRAPRASRYPSLASAIRDRAGRELLIDGPYESSTTVTVPANTTLIGTATGAIRAKVVPSAGVTLMGLTIGRDGVCFSPALVCDGFTADHCRFVGGGSRLLPDGSSNKEAHTVWLNYGRGREVVFTGCTFARPAAECDSFAVVDTGGYPGTYELLLDGCHFERATLMALEFIQRPPKDSTGKRKAPLAGYDVQLCDCVFEGSDGQVASFDSGMLGDTGAYSAARIARCLFGPGGADGDGPYPHGLEMNSGTRATIEDNTFAVCRGYMMNADAPQKGHAGQLWRGNRFGAGDASLHEPGREHLHVTGNAVRFEDNTVTVAGKVFYIAQGEGAEIRGNLITDTMREAHWFCDVDGTHALFEANDVETVGAWHVRNGGTIEVRP